MGVVGNAMTIGSPYETLGTSSSNLSYNPTSNQYMQALSGMQNTAYAASYPAFADSYLNGPPQEVTLEKKEVPDANCQTCWCPISENETECEACKKL